MTTTLPPPVYMFQRNATEQIWATMTTYREKRYLDLRIYYLSAEGTWLPTRKGINVRVEMLPELETMIAKLAAAARAEDAGANGKVAP